MFLFSVLLYQASHAQSVTEKLRFSRIGVNSGLSNSNITCILQDSNGFLWVGTRDGLNKYDGYDFKAYRKIEGDTTSLVRNFILCLYEDRAGGIWVSTQSGGLHRFDRNLNKFTRFKQFNSNCQIDKIIEGFDGSIWVVGYKDNYLFAAQLNNSNHQWKTYNLTARTDEEVKVFIQESEDEFWVGGRRAGFFKWNKKTNTIDHDLNNDASNKIVNNDVHSAVKDGDGNIWIGTEKGLSKFHIKDNRFTNFSYTPALPKTSILNRPILDISLDENYLWLGTENGGLSRFDIKQQQFSNHVFDKNDPSSLSDNSIWVVYKDQQGRIWLGTFSRGLCVFDKASNKFSELDISLKNDVVNAIYQDHKNRLWIGTEDGLIMRDGDRTRHYMLKPKNVHGNSGSPVLSIYQDSKKQIWVGTWAAGLHRYDEKKDQFMAYLPNAKDARSISDRDVFSITEYSKTKQLLVGCFGGLNILTNDKAGYFENHRDEFLVDNNNLLTLLQDSKGRLWTGSTLQLNRYDIEAKSRTRFYLGKPGDSTEINEPVNCIFEDQENIIWAGTGNGLFKVVDDSHIKRYTIENGLPSNAIMGILEDDHGNLWISTSNGISCFNRQTKSFRNFDVNDGLSSNEFKRNSCFKSKDGRLFFGGKGVNIFHPDSIQLNTQRPPVYISDFKVFNHSLEVDGEDGILTKPISETKEIWLPYSSNFFSINYVAVNFTATEKNVYNYKLDGFDQDWINVGRQRSATYTNLDAGTYTFNVKASNNDGIWNEDGTSLIIHIMPPWWNTWWMKMIWVGVLLAILLLIYRIRVKNKYVSRLTKLKEKLENEKYMVDFLMDNLPVLVYFKDKDSRFIRVSKYFVDYFNKDIKDVIGKTDFDIQDEVHARAAFEDEQEIIRTGKSKGQYLEREAHHDGTEKWVSTTKVPLINTVGDVVGIIGISTDVTQVKHYNDELLLREEEIKAQNEELHSQREELATQNDKLASSQEEIAQQNKKLVASEEELIQNLEELKAIQEKLENRNREVEAKEKQLRQIFDGIPAMVFQFKMTPDGQSSFPAISQGSKDIYNLEPEVLMQNPQAALKTIHPKDIKLYQQALIDSASHLNEENHVELRAIVNGKIKWLKSSSVPEKLEDGSILWSGIILDITARKEAEAELNRTREMLEQTNHTARIGGWEVDWVNQIVTWSQVTREIHEVASDFVIDLNAGINFYKEGESRNKITEAIERIAREGTPFDLKLQIVTAKGKDLWIRVMGKSEWINNECKRLYGAFQDIDEQVRASSALVESENNFRQINETIEDVFWLYDVIGNKYIYISPSCEKVWGISREYIYQGKPFIECVLEDDRNKVAKAFESLFTNQSYEIEYRIETKNGGVKWMREKSFSILNDKGVYIRNSGICTDITLLKQAENELQLKNKELILRRNEVAEQNNKLLEQQEEMATQNEELLQSADEISSQRDQLSYQNEKLQSAQSIIEMQNLEIRSRNENLEDEVMKRTKEIVEYNHQLEQFAFISAHNLRAPVARILGLGQILDLPGQPDGEQEEIVKKLIGTTVELDTVVKDLNKILDIRKDSHQPVTELNLHRKLSLAEISLQHEIDASHAIITKDFSRIETIRSVKPYVDSIFLNLVSNAIKYRHPRRDPRIKIRSEINGDYICVHFSDNGLGIDLDAYKEKIFTLYKRFHFHVEGKGLGLYLVKNQIESLGGKIEVESKIDEGTTFHVYFKV